MLSELLVTLAGLPDDASAVDEQLLGIARLAVELVSAVDYASVTVRRDGGYTTVATTSELAAAVDEAQFADEAGPCLDALEGQPVSVPDIATTMAWPGFREQAASLGLQVSLSIPLFAGRGDPVASLNLYGRSSEALAPLAPRIWAVFDGTAGRAPSSASLAGLDAGSEALVTGLAGALEVRDSIQRAVGVVMSREHISTEEAYAVLRTEAADTGASLVDTALAVAIGQSG